MFYFQKFVQGLIWLYTIIFIYKTSISFENQIFLLKRSKIVVPKYFIFFYQMFTLLNFFRILFNSNGFEVPIEFKKFLLALKIKQSFILFIYFHITRFGKSWDVTPSEWSFFMRLTPI